MKKLASVLVLFVLLFAGTAAAEGKLKVTHKYLIIFDGDDTGWFFARVENTGDAPVGVGPGNLVAFTEEDEIAFANSYVVTGPAGAVLDPGEAIFVLEYIWEDVLKEETVADVKFSMEKRNYYSEGVIAIPSEVTFAIAGAGTYDNYVYVTLSNATEEKIVSPYVAAALYDAEGNIVFVGTKNLENVILHPNSTITVAFCIDNNLVTYFGKHGIQVDRAESIVYVAE